MNCKFFNVTSKALCFQLSFIIFFMLLTFHQLEAQDEKAQKVGPGIVKEHSVGYQVVKAEFSKKDDANIIKEIKIVFFLNFFNMKRRC